jgi:hypothetical protein
MMVLKPGMHVMGAFKLLEVVNIDSIVLHATTSVFAKSVIKKTLSICISSKELRFPAITDHLKILKNLLKKVICFVHNVMTVSLI